VDVDDSIKGPKLPPEDAFGELFPREDSPGGAQQGLQQRKLHAGQIQQRVVQPNFTRYGIEAEIACYQRDRRGCNLGGAAQNGANPCNELAWVEWLGQVVVRSDLQTQDSLDIFSPGGQDQHRNRRLSAQPSQNIQTAHAGQHEIENNHGMFSRECALKPTRSFVHGFDREPLGTKALREQSAQLDIIIDDENAIHSLPPATPDSILDHPSTDRSSLYKTLPRLTNLYRTPRSAMLKSRCSTEEVVMKRFIIWSSAALLLVAISIIVVRADGSRRHGWRDRGWSHRGPLGYVAHELNLSDEQKSQIKSMWQAERPTVASLVQELVSEGKEMDSATAQGNLDDSKVQTIAARQGATIAKLLVEKERLKSKIYTSILTPEQRTKADELQKRWHSRLDRVAARLRSDGDGDGGGGGE
jgi:Spy/CpxP family protein refolding chaperone